MNFRILIVAGAILLSGIVHAEYNVAHHKPVDEQGGPFGVGLPQPGIPPNVVTDGEFDPFIDGPLDNTIGSWWMDSECSDPPSSGQPCWLEIRLEGWFLIESFIFQGDNDAYLIQYWDEEPPHWKVAWEVPAGDPAGGIQTRPTPSDDTDRWVLNNPIATNGLRIQANYDEYHDGYYAVTEVQAFGEEIDPCVVAGGTPVNFGCGIEEPESQAHVAAGEICYRFEFSCDGFANGGFGACVYPDSFFDFGMGGHISDSQGPVQGGPVCDFGGMHFLNNKVEHTCSLDGQGKVRLRVKEVGMVHCD